MQEIKLNDFLENRTQDQAAKIMGVSQGAVSKMIRKRKVVYLVFNEDGEIDHWYPYDPRVPSELKQFRPTG